MALDPGSKLGPYEILAPIGSGGMGEVYRARDARLARDVAVKVLPPSFSGDPDRLRRFEQEARATGQLNHPNILAVYDVGIQGTTPYVVEELLEGETLRQRMAGAALPARKAIEYARQIAQGLAAAHQKGIVHRDLKPENIFVTADGRVKILDFGLAKLRTPAAEAGSRVTEAPTQAETGAGVVVGTAGYMSPEQVRGQPTDHRSDIFSFGSILYEMITGRRAFQASSSVETMNAILKEEPPEISTTIQDLPPGLERIVQHCLEKSADERFQSARDLAFHIEALSSTSALTASRQAPPPARRVRGGPALAAGLALAGLAAGFALARLTIRPPGAADYTQLTFRQGAISAARFTPDGESVMYSAAWDGGPIEIFSMRPGSPESRPLGLASADILGISSTGEMAVLLDARFTLGFQRSGTLAKVPLSGGVPRQVVEEVQDADWSPDGRELAVARTVDGRSRLECPIGKVLHEGERWIGSLRFSRDGARIGFIEHPNLGDNRGLVAVADLSGSVRRLTEPFSTAGGLAWSPGGDEIWFTAGRTGNVRALYAVDLAGQLRMVDGAPADLSLEDVGRDGRVLMTRNSARRGMMGLAPGEREERDLSWLDWSRPAALSPDGRWVLFEEQGQGGGPDYAVYLRGTDGSPAVKLGDGYAQALSPDGRLVATAPVDRSDRIVLLPRAAGEPRALPMPGFLVNRVRWLPDGARFVVLMAEAGHLGRLFVVDPSGGAPRPTSPEGVGFEFAISPDGRLVAATLDGGGARLLPVDGGEPRPIDGVGPEDRILSWSRDGGSLLVARAGRLPARVDRLELSSGRRTRWIDLIPSDKAGLSDISYIQFSDDGLSYVYSYRRFLSTLYLARGVR